MPETFGAAISMTLIGMGVVFIVLVVLWAMMAGLNRLTQDRRAAPVLETRAADVAARQARIRRAAVTAVAIALAQQTVEALQVHEFPLPPTSIVSAWQAVMRSSTLNRRGPKR